MFFMLFVLLVYWKLLNHFVRVYFTRVHSVIHYDVNLTKKVMIHTLLQHGPITATMVSLSASSWVVIEPSMRALLIHLADDKNESIMARYFNARQKSY